MLEAGSAISRKDFVAGSAIVALSLAFGKLIPPGYLANLGEAPPKITGFPHKLSIGITVNPYEFDFFGLPWLDTFKDMLRERRFDSVRFVWTMNHPFEENIERLTELYKAADEAGVTEKIQGFDIKQPGGEYYLPGRRGQVSIPFNEYLPLLARDYSRLTQTDIFTQADVIQYGNESNDYFKHALGSPPEPLDFQRKNIEMIRQSIEGTGKRLLLTDALINDNPDSWQEILRQNPDIAGVNPFLQMDWFKYTLARLSQAFDLRLEAIKEKGISILASEVQLLPWPPTVPMIVRNPKQAMELLEFLVKHDLMFSDSDRRSLFYLTASKVPHILIWEIVKSYYLAAKKGLTKPWDTTADFIEIRDRSNATFSPAEHTSR